MAEAVHAPLGHWCWPELSVPDPAAARAFYGPLLGWEAAEAPGSGGTYWMFTIDGLDCAGACAQGLDEKAAGVPPHWRNYVKVASADAAAARAEELGGQVLAGPFDIPGVGRMAHLADPAGTAFAVWQDGGHAGVAVQGVWGSHCWTERMAADADTARDFLTDLFGWSTEALEGINHPYTQFFAGETAVGGLMAMEGPEWQGVPDHFMQYFLVEDCTAAAGRAGDLGGRVCVPPTDIPGIGRFAILDDPQGATFALLQPALA